ncbi:polymerase delta-interacting protein 3-like isoform X2 [Portunus trituberculatus]|nr:polymerase delta-interacting protein 3-like isoform X2 [Portunus trituberculatus]
MADVSLDDIIQQRKFRFGKPQGMRVNDGGGKSWMPTKGRLIKSTYLDHNSAPQSFGDVRNKIIQNKRLRMRDARDRLAELAKQGDARERINKMRRKTVPLKKSPISRPPGKIIHNENRPSYLAGKTQMKGTSLIRTVAGEMNSTKPGLPVRHQQAARDGWLQAVQKTSNASGRYHPIPNNPHVVTIKNEKAELQNSYPHNFNRVQTRSQPVKLTARAPLSRAGGLTSFSSSREMSGMRSAGMMRARSPVQLMHRPRKSPDLEEVRPTRLEITTSNNYREPSPTYSDEWDLPARHPPRLPVTRPVPARLPEPEPERLAVRVPAKKRPIYDEKHIEPMRHPKKVASISSGLMARLDQPQRPSQVQGTKVLVTNLHHCVSVEDMEELFGTIGNILSARMVREGVAEAVFMNEEDAYKSVEVFNNRQLDGQPMCVSVVNKKVPVLAAAAPPQPSRTETKSVLKAARGRTGYYI